MTRNCSTSCPCQRLPILKAEQGIWWLWEYFSTRVNLQVRKHQQLRTLKGEKNSFPDAQLSKISTTYLFISLMTLLTLSKPGLDPQLASMSSIGTELKTIDVITLQGKWKSWHLKTISFTMLAKLVNLHFFQNLFNCCWFSTNIPRVSDNRICTAKSKGVIPFPCWAFKLILKVMNWSFTISSTTSNCPSLQAI